VSINSVIFLPNFVKMGQIFKRLNWGQHKTRLPPNPTLFSLKAESG